MTYIEQETIYDSPRVRGKLRIIFKNKSELEYNLNDIDWVQIQKEIQEPHICDTKNTCIEK